MVREAWNNTGKPRFGTVVWPDLAGFTWAWWGRQLAHEGNMGSIRMNGERWVLADGLVRPLFTLDPGCWIQSPWDWAPMTRTKPTDAVPYHLVTLHVLR
jgi:hypothetical protein